jgi:putative tricarboxylic transport membrane protein
MQPAAATSFPTLFFGIPGSGSMGLLLGAFILIGIKPGFSMIRENLHLTFVIIWSLVLGNLFGALLCMGLAGPIARLTTVRYGLLAPMIIVLMIFTAYQATLSWWDLGALIVLTIVGLYMKRFDWPRPALIVGFVLSQGLESSLYKTAQVYGLSFLARPQSLLIAVILAASLAASIYVMARTKNYNPEESGPPPASRLPQILFAALALGAVGYLVATSFGMAYLTRIYPMGVGFVVLLLLIGILCQQALGNQESPVLADSDQTSGPRASKFIYLG